MTLRAYLHSPKITMNQNKQEKQIKQNNNKNNNKKKTYCFKMAAKILILLHKDGHVTKMKKMNNKPFSK